jgi:hypothetical protein
VPAGVRFSLLPGEMVAGPRVQVTRRATVKGTRISQALRVCVPPRSGCRAALRPSHSVVVRTLLSFRVAPQQ